MGIVITNVGYSLMASIIYDISKVCLGKIYYKEDECTIEKIEKLLQDKLDDKYEILCMSGQFNNFLRTPFFKDTIENYIIYKITGISEGNLRKVKKNNNIIMEQDVNDFLLDNLLHTYDEETLTIPSKTLVRQFFELFFKTASNYIISLMKDENKMDVFLVNRRIDFAQENIMLRFNETVETIKRTMKCEIIPINDIYDDNIKEYHNILKINNSQAHIYLLDTFEFSEFYVPPILRQNSPNQEIIERIRWMRHDYLMYVNNKRDFEDDTYFDDWKYIFDNTGLVYVTGGAGYGKSLFLKKIINDYEKMNILNSSEYLVIYGDLKSFYKEGEQPISVVEFLQDSMVKETLMDKCKFPTEMIDYYLKMGRCLILLDALDEVEKQKREKLHKKIISYFKAQNPNNKICITSRNRGFIPEKDIEVFDILPLDEKQIESYVDNIIKLGKFDFKDKKVFLDQTEVLVKKGFLNSFLVLSLLINIYKAERELPENKMELYQKCFEYIACRREKEKTKAKYDWDLISYMMKDNTFMELAKMCFPNNSDIGKDEIVEMLCNTYSKKYSSIEKTERAAEHFLAFCSDRTELFVPAAGEDRYKFFHRSFFEYFYAQYIFLRIREVREVYDSFQKFDVDSEVFELFLAMMKQKDEPRYQELMNYIFFKADEQIEERSVNLSAFNILTLGMQVVDDKVYVRKYIEYIINNNIKIIKNVRYIPNQRIIYNVVSSEESFVKRVINAYETSARLRIIETFLEQFLDAERIISRKEFQEIPDQQRKRYISRDFLCECENVFYIRLYIENVQYNKIMNGITESDLNALMLECNVSKKTREKYAKLYRKYKALDVKKQRILQEIILCDS